MNLLYLLLVVWVVFRAIHLYEGNKPFKRVWLYVFSKIGGFTSLVLLLLHVYLVTTRQSSHIKFIKERAVIVEMVDKNTQRYLAKDWNRRRIKRIHKHKHVLLGSQIDSGILLVDSIGSEEIDLEYK